MLPPDPRDVPIPSDLPRLPARPLDAHKGTFGSVSIVGGTCSPPARDDADLHQTQPALMLGAPVLSAQAALRTGAGLVRLVVPEPLAIAAVARVPEAMGTPLPVSPAGELIAHACAPILDRVVEQSTVIAAGPGLMPTDAAAAVVLRLIQQDLAHLVLDAGALTVLAQTPELFRDLKCAAVFTPHPGEFKRLCEGLNLKDHLGLARDRAAAATALAQRLGQVIVLKGHGTVVSDGLRTWTCPTDHPCLATAGTGDVLTGVIAGLIAQFAPSPQQALFRSRVPGMPTNPERRLNLFACACLGVYVHASAGVAWAARHRASAGLRAGDLPDLLPALVERHREA